MVFNCQYLHFIFNDALCAGTTPSELPFPPPRADIVSVKPPLAS